MFWEVKRRSAVAFIYLHATSTHPNNTESLAPRTECKWEWMKTRRLSTSRGETHSPGAATLTRIRSHVAAPHMKRHTHKHTLCPNTIPSCRAELLSWPELHQKSLIWERDHPQFQQAGIRMLRADSEFKDKMGWGCRFWNHPWGWRYGMEGGEGGGEVEWYDLPPPRALLVCAHLPSVSRGTGLLDRQGGRWLPFLVTVIQIHHKQLQPQFTFGCWSSWALNRKEPTQSYSS